LAPLAPGTVGSAAALAIAWIFELRQGLLAVLAIAAGLTGVWASAHAIRAYGNEDPPQVVVDEVAGMWLALSGATVLNPVSLLAGLALFRLFDIWKPFPVRRLERLPGGYGIMADDLAAGACAALVLFLAGCLNLY
jgi:phosphatidylglycerophosphatase A